MGYRGIEGPNTNSEKSIMFLQHLNRPMGRHRRVSQVISPPNERRGFVHKAIGKGLGAIGDIAKKAAPIVGLVPGVGTLAAAGLGAVGGGLGTLNDPGANFGNFLGNTAGGAAGGALGGLAGGALGGIGGLGGGGTLGTIGNIAQIGSAALGTIQGARQQGQANELQRRAIAQAEADFASRQPFRDRLSASFDNPAQRQDLGDIFGTENPFSRSISPIGPAQQGPIPQGPAPQLGPISLPPGFRTIDERATTNRERNRGRNLGGADRRRDELA